MGKKVKKTASALRANRPQAHALQAFSPPPYRWLLMLLLGIETLLIIWALTHQFIPSTQWRNIAFYTNIILCACCIAYFAYAFWLNAQLYPSKLKLLLKALGLPVLIYFGGYIALTYGVGDAVTYLIGKPAMMEDILTKNANDDIRFKKEYVAKGEFEKRYFDNRKGCITRLTSDTLQNALPVHYCVSGQDFAILPKHVAVNIHGLQSELGFDVRWIEYNWLKTSLLPFED